MTKRDFQSGLDGEPEPVLEESRVDWKAGVRARLANDNLAEQIQRASEDAQWDRTIIEWGGSPSERRAKIVSDLDDAAFRRVESERSLDRLQIQFFIAFALAGISFWLLRPIVFDPFFFPDLPLVNVLVALMSFLPLLLVWTLILYKLTKKKL